MRNLNFKAGLSRLCAFLIDVMVLLALYAGAYFLLKQQVTHLLESGTGSYVVLTFTVFVIPSVYFILLWHLCGATVGMFALKLRLVEFETGKKPMLFIALWRYVIFYLSWFSFLIGFLWSLWDSRTQTWADKLSGTLVIKKAGETIPANADDKRKWQTGKWLVYASLVMLIAVNVIWQYEQPLLPEAEAALMDFQPEKTPQNNGFYELACFGAGENIDPFETGLAAVKRVNESTMELYRASGFWGQKYDVEIESIDYNSLNPELDTLITFSDSDDYFGEIAGNSEMIKRNIEEYEYLEKRYDHILEYEYISNPLFQDIFVGVPIYMPLVQYQRLYCADIALKYMEGDRETAMRRLENSIAVSSRLMEDASSLIVKLVAIILYRIDVDVCKQLINYENDIDPILAKTLINLPDFSDKSMSFRSAFMGEFNVGAAFIVRLIDSPKGLLDYSVDREDIQRANPPFIKANQILNHSYHVYKRMYELSELPWEEFYEECEVSIEFSLNWLEYVNNPIGAILDKSLASLVYTSYEVMGKDNQLHQNLLKAGAAIKQQEIEMADVPAFLEANKAKWGNLYTGKALDWDAETMTLSFDGPARDGRGNDRELRLIYN